MLRPSGFPEYSPSQQKIYDQILTVIGQSFSAYNYDHIWTPAVEKTTILTKWWEDVQNQIFGLHGLKQWAQDIKEYALHFDLTVPFARYTLDHLHQITLPFKRYQMQPVWRWERSQKGRFKEFWQCDIDSIWRSEMEMGVCYDIETITVLQKTLQAILDHFELPTTFVTRVSHIWLTKKWLSHIGISNISAVCALLDDYHKQDATDFQKALETIVQSTQVDQILHLLHTQDYTILKWLDGYEDLAQVITIGKKLWCHIAYDFSIVRGLGYYTGTVFETFLSDGGGSICSWGAYSHFTDFIDPKQSLSGVGWSIGISRMMDYIMEKIQSQMGYETYLVINFAETQDQWLALQDKLIQAGKTVEFYPLPHKLKKQFEYADRKGIRYCIIYGPWEQEHNHIIVKDLHTWSQSICPIEYCAGVVPVYRQDETYYTLLVEMAHGPYRSYPKWHIEAWESVVQTATRELFEETGIQISDIDPNKTWTEYILVHTGSRTFFKEVTYVLWRCETQDQTLTYDHKEIIHALWCSFSQAQTIATYPTTQKLIQKINRTLIS